MANTLVDTDLPVPAYGSIYNLLSTGMGPPHTCRRLTHIACYIVQGEPECQHRVFDSTVCDLKWPFLSLPDEAKDSVSAKKLLEGEGGWTCVKEVLGWIIETVALPERKLQELQDLLAIQTTNRRMGRKELDHLVGKLCSMHLVAPASVSQLYHLQSVLAQDGMDWAWQTPEFNREIANWRPLVDQTSAWSTPLKEIVRSEPTHLGFIYAVVI